MKLIYHDGGRKEAGYKGSSNDCTCRSIAIATEQSYQEVYKALNHYAKKERPRKSNTRSSARTGVARPTIRRYLKELGWTWVPTMFIGQGCKVHLHDGELPMGRLIVSVSKHITCVIDEIIYDTHDPQRYTLIIENGVKRIGRRCVYGYWHKL